MRCIGRVVSKLGLKFSERLYGDYAPLDGSPVSRYDFTVDCKADDLYVFFIGDDDDNARMLGLEGVLRVKRPYTPGVAEVPIKGSLTLFDGMTLRYKFTYDDPFTSEKMLYLGEKILKLREPVQSMRTLYGEIFRLDGYNDPVKTADALSIFSLMDLFAFCKTWSLRRSK